LVDALMPSMSGIELIERLAGKGYKLPAIVITGNADVPMAVQAMKAGAVDFIEKPVPCDVLQAIIKRAFNHTQDTAPLSASGERALSVASLTTRQRQILDLVLAGYSSRDIASDLGLSQRTVDNHRAAIMRKTGSKSLPALFRTALAAT
jgi:two-component system, chemotaxis family, CheB/CheR fusion protein